MTEAEQNIQTLPAFHSHPFKLLRMGFSLFENDTTECQKRDFGNMVRFNQKNQT
jgi:hypothetical protein